MTSDLMDVTDFLKLGCGGRVATYRGPAVCFIYRTARGESASGVRAFKIKHAPAFLLNIRQGFCWFFALFFDKWRPEYDRYWSGQAKTDTQLSDFCQSKITLKNIWGFVSQKRMETVTVIKHFNIPDYVTPGIVPKLAAHSSWTVAASGIGMYLTNFGN